MSALYLLDTNILVHLIRGDATGQRIRAEYKLFTQDPKPAICVVSEGEIRSLALQFLWGSQKVNQMEYAIAHLGRLTIDKPAVINAYATLDAHAQAKGIAMGKNDLWIAATAFVADARLLTTDRDFDHLNPDFIAVERLLYTEEK